MIGLVTSAYPSEPGDPAGCFIADRAAALAATDVVEVVAPVPATRVEAGGRVHVTPAGPAAWEARRALAGGAPDAFESAGRRHAYVAAAALQLAMLDAVSAKAPRWSRVESHWLVPSALAVVATTRLPHTAWAHSGDVAWLERAAVGRSLARVLASQVNELVFVSSDLRARFVRRLGGAPCAPTRVEALEAPSVFAATRRAPASAPRVVAVGRLVPIKGFDVLVLALARLPRPVRPCLVLVGDGAERARLERLARACEVELRVTGLVPRAEVATWLASAHLCVIPSRPMGARTEGAPLVAREALAIGVPLVVSATGGLAALAAAEPRRVVAVPPAEPAALAKAVASVLSGA